MSLTRSGIRTISLVIGSSVTLVQAQEAGSFLRGVSTTSFPVPASTMEAKETATQVNPKEEAPLSFDNFLKAVESSNLVYASMKYNVPIAQAQVSLARLWPNPTITGGFNAPFHQGNTIPGIASTPDGLNQDLPNTTTASISQTIPLGGKLSAKEAVAQTAVTQAQAQLLDYFRNLRATAAGAYIDSLTAQLVAEKKQQAYDSLKALADLNEVRFKDGDIAQADLLQARLAAMEARTDWQNSLSTLRQDVAGLAVYVGKKNQYRVAHPVGNLAVKLRQFDIENLVQRATVTRSDVLVALRNRDNLMAQYHVTQSNRVPDLTVSVNYTHNSASENNFAPSPSNDQVGFNLSIPLPLSNIDKDDLVAARLAIIQADKQIEAAQVQAETDVRQAAARYKFAQDTVDQFSHGILNDAQQSLDMTLYSYKKGAGTLLDVRQAESDLNSTFQNYYAALDEETKALVNLEEAAGLWDVQL